VPAERKRGRVEVPELVTSGRIIDEVGKGDEVLGFVGAAAITFQKAGCSGLETPLSRLEPQCGFKVRTE
jgi:hypothetical protein